MMETWKKKVIVLDRFSRGEVVLQNRVFLIVGGMNNEGFCRDPDLI